MGENARLLYEQRSWGDYTVLQHTTNPDGTESLTKLLRLTAGCNISLQYHRCRREVWTIIQGTGSLILGAELRGVAYGDVIDIPVGALHSLRAESELHLVEVQLGSPLSEDDIVRLAVSWADVCERYKADK